MEVRVPASRMNRPKGDQDRERGFRAQRNANVELCITVLLRPRSLIRKKAEQSRRAARIYYSMFRQPTVFRLLNESKLCSKSLDSAQGGPGTPPKIKLALMGAAPRCKESRFGLRTGFSPVKLPARFSRLLWSKLSAFPGALRGPPRSRG